MPSHHYFDFFPKIDYDIDKNGILQTVTDITRRFDLRPIIFKQGVLYDSIEIREGERPDMLAHRLYGEPELDWLIFLANRMLDPLWDWPLSHWELVDHVKKKYGSLSNARNQIHHYEKIVYPETKSPAGTRVPEVTIYVDSETYAATPEESRRRITMLDWEQFENARKRKIRVMAKRYIPQILKEIEQVFVNG